jgi:predicted alpha/beta-hydrolase family hydrolase
MSDRISIAVADRRTTGLVYPADPTRRTGATLVLAHGAGAGQTSGFIVQFAKGLAARGVDVLTFNFLYTEQRRKAPDRTEALEACYRAAVAAARDDAAFAGNKVFVGGKSMGGRIASHLAAAGDETAAVLSGLVLLGYPLHSPGKPDQLRVAHLPKIRVPVLIIQGERDPFGSPEELRPHVVAIGSLATIHVVERGDHSLAPPKGASQSIDQVYSRLQDVIAGWIGAGSQR